jgi:transcriptional repressor NrdR
MKCPKCGCEKSTVYDTRPFGEETYRRRLCSGCNRKFITFERAQDADDTKVFVRKRRKRKETTA